LEEAKKINKSLTALGMVIYSLTDGKVKQQIQTIVNPTECPHNSLAD
jgi:hypothetical protein